jgi:hypothetical protein
VVRDSNQEASSAEPEKHRVIVNKGAKVMRGFFDGVANNTTDAFCCQSEQITGIPHCRPVLFVAMDTI